ncbi:copper chaperone PCu(A)C [Nitrospirillum amazonense]|uniref:copper chaperone PCu(A)C n=1 Tax=Nitrospirillum amazonense TaxID=28077 RepID=UPI002DD43FD9|nr:copper chaperone PCu(A)C [Nitrospirillum amazonense]MEC4589658.1 copper chaperone PCu(A)C [Nitrospirillum amazonense]
MTRTILTAGALWALLAGAGLAQQAPAVTVTDAWSRPVPNTKIPGVVYMTVTATADNRLTGISTPVANHAGIHQSQESGGMASMHAVDSIDLPAGRPVTLGPAGYHVMLMGLTKPLVAGQSFPLTLDLDHGGPVTVAVTIRPLGAGAQAKGDK